MRLMIATLALVLLIVVDQAWYRGKYTSAVNHAIMQTISRFWSRGRRGSSARPRMGSNGFDQLLGDVGGRTCRQGLIREDRAYSPHDCEEPSQCGGRGPCFPTFEPSV